jgi:SAM-dependent methyltransferase
MAHLQQQIYCFRVKDRFPKYFKNAKVLDVGSLDINGSNRNFFESCKYLGIDIADGKNVDYVSIAHEFTAPDGFYDTIISTEVFEHDMYVDKSLKNIIRLLKPGGLFLFTCATTGRPEHGTIFAHPESSPLTTKLPGWDSYYKTLTEQDIRIYLDIENIFSKFEFSVLGNDLRFWGIKK